jgi:hypothetical protein
VTWGEALWVIRASLLASTKSRAHCWDGARCRRAISIVTFVQARGPPSGRCLEKLSHYNRYRGG